LVSQALVDFLEFDGNPQGLRIATRLQWNTDEFGLNLTATALASFLKYVRCAGDGLRDGNFRKKAGFFTTESEIVKKVWDEFGYSSPQRFPLAYIMEAADDIAYCISDLEDSFEKEIVSEIWALPKLAELYMEKGFGSDDPCHEEIKTSLMAIRDGKLDGKEFTYTDFRTRINSAIVRYAAQRYVDDEVTIACGSHKGLLPEDEPPGFVLKVLKDFCRDHVYNHVSIQRVELAGYNAISGLLDQFRPLLTASRKRFTASLAGERIDENGSRILLEPKLLRLLPERYKKVYQHHLKGVDDAEHPDIQEWVVRAHLIVDFISGMTDDFAMSTYRTLAGIEL
jgi:dGTPase